MVGKPNPPQPGHSLVLTIDLGLQQIRFGHHFGFVHGPGLADVAVGRLELAGRQADDCSLLLSS